MLSPRPAVATFEEAALGYLKGGGDARFLGKYDENMGKWTGLIGHFAGTLLREIGQGELNEAAIELLPEALPQTRNRQIYTPFVAVWNHGVLANLCEERTWRRPKLDGTGMRQRWATYDEVELLVNYAPEHLKPLIIFLAYTGARPIEALKLIWKDLSLLNRWAVLRKTKTGGDRGIALHQRVVEALEGISGPRVGNVFKTDNGEPYASKENAGGQFKTAWHATCRRAGLAKLDPTDPYKKRLLWNDEEPLVPYCLRHGTGTWLGLVGVLKQTRDQILGHGRKSDMDARYVHVPVPEIVDGIDRLPWGGAVVNPAMQDLIRRCNARHAA